jgi:hypothetical protein
MNRAERRRNGITEKPKTITFTEQAFKQEVEKEMQAVKKATMTATINAMMATMAVSLNDLHGFGAKRLKELASKIQLQFECIEKGTVKLDELLKESERIGLTISSGGDYRQ